eukprot:141559_1
MLSLFGAPAPRKTIRKRKFHECKQYLQAKHLITGYFKKIASSHSAIPEALITNILDFHPRKLLFDIFPHQITRQEPVSSDDILDELGHTATIGCSTGFSDGIHEWVIPLSSKYPSDEYHYYFGVVTDVDQYVHSNSQLYSEWKGIGYISSTFSSASFSDLFKPKYRVKNAETVRIRLDCVKWTFQVWINDKLDDCVSYIIDGECIENAEESTEHPLVSDQIYFPVVGIYKKVSINRMR